MSSVNGKTKLNTGKIGSCITSVNKFVVNHLLDKANFIIHFCQQYLFVTHADGTSASSVFKWEYQYTRRFHIRMTNGP